MEPFVRPFLNGGFNTELIYSFIIIVCSLMIYYGTKELYELSSYKGIKYFRQAFLFFAIAYFFRSIIKFFLIFSNLKILLYFPSRLFEIFTLVLFMYFSSMAVFYLFYSVMWKKWDGSSKKIYLFHALAFIIGIASISSRSILFYLLINLLLFIFIIFIVYTAYKYSKNKKRKKHNLYIVYVLLSIFWILNIFDILVPNFLQTFQLIIYLVSSGIFLTILYKVLRKTGPG